jgi:hypothetical protein
MYLVSVVNCDYGDNGHARENSCSCLISQNGSKFSFQSHLELKSFLHICSNLVLAVGWCFYLLENLKTIFVIS